MGGGVGYGGVCVGKGGGGVFAVAIWNNLLPRLQQKLLRQRQAGSCDATTSEFPRGAGALDRRVGIRQRAFVKKSTHKKKNQKCRRRR